MTIFFVETTLSLDGQPLQLAFHFPPGAVVPDLPRWPPAQGRRWRGQRVQARALEVARAYLTQCG
jgi:hypothetical protein